MSHKLEDFFPEIEHGLKVCGGGVLIQGKFIPKKTSSGIILTDSTAEVANYDVTIGKVVAFGDLAYKDKQTLEPWKEGNWCEVGDIVSIPRTGSRYTREIDGQQYHFVLVQDTEIKTVFKDINGYDFGAI